VKPIERAAINEDLTVLVLGGGFSGMVTSVHLVENGITNFKIIEKGGDFGGTASLFEALSCPARLLTPLCLF
jgi:cation diffusion facilitator CzcD-associated flavoprotein CzcO